MKTKLKIMMALLVAICITGISTVNAATEFSDENKNVIVTLDKDLGIAGTKTEVEYSDYRNKNICRGVDKGIRY